MQRAVARLLAGLLLLAALGATQGQILSACPGVTVQAKTSRRTVVPGSLVRLVVAVKNTGTEAVSGLGVRVSSTVASAWKAKTGHVTPRIEGTNVDWLGQALAPGKGRRYRVQARVCAGITPGLQTLAQVAVYRLNATGGVACLSSAPRITVRVYSCVCVPRMQNEASNVRKCNGGASE